MTTRHKSRAGTNAPALTYVDWLLATAGTRPDKPAVIEDDQAMSYQLLMECAARTAAALTERGVMPGQPVGLAMEPSTVSVVSFLAILLAGAVAAPLNTRLTPAELRAYTDSLGLKRAIADSRYSQMMDMASLDDVIHVPGRAAPGLERQMGDLLGSQSMDYGDRCETDPAVIFPTGGTTGLPKGAYADQRGLVTWTLNAALSGHRGYQDIELYFSPCFHVTYVVGVLTPLCMGNTIVVQSSFRPSPAIEAIQHWRVNRLMGAPTMFKALMDQADADGIVLTEVEHVLFGSAATGGDLVERMSRVFPNAGLMTGLGATEFASGVSRIEADQLRGVRAGGVGQVLPGAQLKILDSVGQEVPAGTVGELAVRSPWQTLGYWNQEDETASAYLDDGFIRIGDLGFVDADGWLTLTGRSKDVIVSGGENIFPQEIESAIGKFASIDEVVVFGVEDDHWGERVEAAVTLKAGCEVDLDTIRNHACESVADYKVPKRFHILETLPLTSNNKPDRRALSTMFSAKGTRDGS